MNCYNRVLEYITSCEKGMPIFIEEIKKYIIKFYDENDRDKIILSMILYLSDDTGSCFASNK